MDETAPDWNADTVEKIQIEKVARALMAAEGKSTKPDDRLTFFDPFRWDGHLTTEAGAHRPGDILNNRPAWTAPRIIRMAVAAIVANRADGRVSRNER